MQLTVADVNFFRKLTLNTNKNKRPNTNNNEGVNPDILNTRVNKLYVFARNKLRIEHNIKCLRETSELLDNPVALFRTNYTGGPKRLGKPVKKHFIVSGSNDNSPNRTKFCVGCKVSIQGRNFMPQWGLYNSVMGTVVEIHFTQEIGAVNPPNPNHGDLCDYVVVNFPAYKGPVWDPLHPKQVPIPIVNQRCQYGC